MKALPLLLVQAKERAGERAGAVNSEASGFWWVLMCCGHVISQHLHLETRKQWQPIFE
jgi:hypothetical protein